MALLSLHQGGTYLTTLSVSKSLYFFAVNKLTHRDMENSQ